MEKYKLDDGLLEDLEDLIPVVEDSFNIKFASLELADVDNFDTLVNRIIAKIDLPESETCTSALFFYKIKKAILAIGMNPEINISPSTNLKDILPVKNRKNFEKKLNEALGLNTKILSLAHTEIILYIIINLISFILLFFDWKMGLLCLLTWSAVFDLRCQFSNRIHLRDIRELVNEYICVNYLKVRKDGTVNRKELKVILKKWFVSELGLDECKLDLYIFS